MPLPPHFLHDLKNHLATVLGFSELLIAQLPAGDPIRADLEEIHRAAQDAITLCRSVRADADHLESDRTE